MCLLTFGGDLPISSYQYFISLVANELRSGLPVTLIWYKILEAMVGKARNKICLSLGIVS